MKFFESNLVNTIFQFYVLLTMHLYII